MASGELAKTVASGRISMKYISEIIPYTTESDWLLRRQSDLTSTEIAALFGCSPYTSAFELWHRKASGTTPEFTPTERTEWGLVLQDSIAGRIATQQGWKIRRMDEYIRIPELRLGSSFDFFIEPSEALPEGALLEIKNVDSLQFSRGWIIDGEEIEAPAHIELQVQHQMLVSGHVTAYIGALVGGNTLKLMRREINPGIQTAIIQKAAEFWASVSAGIEPPPAYPGDADAVIRMSQYAEPGKIVSGTEVIAKMAAEYRDLKQGIKALDEQSDTLKAEMLRMIGDAEKVKGEGYTISAGITGESEIAYTRKAYRNFRVTWKGVK